MISKGLDQINQTETFCDVWSAMDATCLVISMGPIFHCIPVRYESSRRRKALLHVVGENRAAHR